MEQQLETRESHKERATLKGSMTFGKEIQTTLETSQQEIRQL